jgi:ubiquinol-cytochrome c reductase cytochrome c1 subunit
MRSILAASLLALAFAAPARAEEGIPPYPKVNWSFAGPFGTYDRASAQRGFQVYNEVCSACHSMRLMSYRNLEAIGLSQAQVRAIAASKTVPGGTDDSGKPITRPGLPSDPFASPFPNDKAARAANNGAVPPDQSDLLKAREGGANYIHALLLGYKNPPPGVKIPDGLYYNEYFPGHAIHMPPPLADGSVTYADGTKATLDQEARDVTTFLAFASHPEMEQRKRMGVKVALFLAMLGCVTYAYKRRVWSHLHH